MNSNGISPSYITIGGVFERNFLFEVPKYQRYYSWDDDQVDDYIRDIKNIYYVLEKGQQINHFFGGIVCVRKMVPGSNRQQRELIDGQQRIATTILLINNLLNNYKGIKDPQLSEILKMRIERLAFKYLVYQDEINRNPQKVSKLILSKADDAYFQALLSGSQIAETRDSHEKIKNANERISKFLIALLKGKSSAEKLDVLSRIEDILHNNCSIIFIEAESKDVAYKLFQVLNDRGTGLNAGDLLKSMTLDLLDRHYSYKQKTIEDFWDEMLEGEAKENEDFLKTFYASYSGNRAGRASLYDDFRKFFFSHFEKEYIDIEQDANLLENTIKEILLEYRIYKKIVEGEWPYPIAQPITEWQRKRLHVLVKYLGFDIILPLLLAASKLDHRKFFEIVFSLEKFMFRYKTICKLPHQKIGIFFSLEAKKIRQNIAGYKVKEFLKSLENYIDSEANDQLFAANLENMTYTKTGSNRPIKYFLSTLSELSSITLGRFPTQIIDYENVSIEHVCAINATKPSSLTIDINKLQNLTLLTLDENDKAANKDFLLKKPIYDNSVYIINKKLTTFSKWDDTSSKEWLSYLKQLAVQVFKVK